MKEYIVNLEFHVTIRDVDQERKDELKRIKEKEREESNRLAIEIQQKLIAASKAARKNKKGSE